jgi:hypothetical protein
VSWPQVTIIVLWTIGLMMHLLENGKPMAGKYNFFAKCAAVGLHFWILSAGGSR